MSQAFCSLQVRVYTELHRQEDKFTQHLAVTTVERNTPKISRYFCLLEGKSLMLYVVLDLLGL